MNGLPGTKAVRPAFAHGAAALAEWLIGHGSDGIVVTGSTGEASTLTDDEQVEVWRAVRAAVPHRTVIAGSGVNDTRHAVELTAHATKAGMDRPHGWIGGRGGEIWIAERNNHGGRMGK